MSFIDTLKGLVNKMLGRQEVTSSFKGISSSLISSNLYTAMQAWDKLYKNDTLAPVIANDLATMTCVDMQYSVSEDTDLGKNIKKVIDNINFTSKLELFLGYGGGIIKPSGKGYNLDFVPANMYIPISENEDGDLVDVIFIEDYIKDGKTYTKLERQYFDDYGFYIIDRKTYVSTVGGQLGYETNIANTIWAGSEPQIIIKGIDKPLFIEYKTPIVPNCDPTSHRGASVFSRAVDEIVELADIYNQFKIELKNSQAVLFVDEQSLMKPSQNGGRAQTVNPLPNLVKGIRFGNNSTNCVEKWAPEIRVGAYKDSIELALNLICTKIGVSPTFYNFDKTTGTITATQVASDDRKTITYIANLQNSFKNALDRVIPMMIRYISIFEEEVNADTVVEYSFSFKDLFVNDEVDMENDYKLVQAGFIPRWKYLVNWYGCNEEEAKRLVDEANSEHTTNNNS